MATLPATASVANEDFAAVLPNGAVLLDGAGLSGNRTKCVHGVAWFSHYLGSTLAAALGCGEPGDLRSLLADSIAITADAHRATCDLNDPATPSATVVLVRVTGDELEYLVLADSTLVIEHLDQAPEVVTDAREADIGQKLRAEMDSLPTGTPEHDDARRAYVRALQDYRNRPGGFWVATADPHAAAEALTGTRPIAGLRAAVLLSDGASRLADRFNLATWPDVLRQIASDGPQSLLDAVRAAENADPRGERWPRGKNHDDATAIRLSL